MTAAMAGPIPVKHINLVADRVHGEVLCYGPVDLFQEADELLGAVTRQALADDLASLDIECRKQGRRAIAFVVVRHRLSTAIRV
jgi:hypothetical protein